MASQVSPGVIIKERDLSNAVVVGSSALRGAFSSTFSKGPVGSICLLYTSDAADDQ